MKSFASCSSHQVDMALKSHWIMCEAVVIMSFFEVSERKKTLRMGEYLEDHPNHNGAIHRLEDSWYRNQQIHLEDMFLM